MPYATPSDLATSLMRDLTPTETTYAPDLLARAESLLAGLVSELGLRAESPDYAARLVAVEADMVGRVMRNPDGILTESQGLYTYRVDVAVASGRLAPTRDELASLGKGASMQVATGALDGYAAARYIGSGAHPFLAGG